MNEIFRARNIYTRQDQSSVLYDLNINIFAGEILGVFGVSNSGKSVILDLIEQKVTPMYGSVFFNGELCRKDEKKSITTVRITREGTLLGNRSIWENLLVIRRHIHKSILLRPSLLIKHLNQLLGEYCLDINAEQRAGDLNKAERFIIELLKAKLANAEAILVDNVDLDFTAVEFEKINLLLKKLNSEKIPIIVTSSHIDHLKKCTDRIVFLHAGHALKTIVNEPLHDPQMVKIMSYLLPNFTVPDGTSLRQKNEYADKIRTLCLKSAQNKLYHVNLYPGEVTAIINLSQDRLDLAEEDRKPRILMLDLDMGKMILETLSPGDNLCLGIYKRLSKLGFIIKQYRQNIIDEFTDWYGKKTLAQKADCRSISELDKLAIILFRLLISKPDVLIGSAFSIIRDKTIHRMIYHNLVELAKNGSTIGFVVDGLDMLEDFADRYVVINENGISQDVDYNEIKVW
jgi:ABC-type sugar transport system ATPase subunit